MDESVSSGRQVQPHRSGGGHTVRTVEDVVKSVPLPNYTQPCTRCCDVDCIDGPCKEDVCVRLEDQIVKVHFVNSEEVDETDLQRARREVREWLRGIE